MQTYKLKKVKVKRKHGRKGKLKKMGENEEFG